MPRKLKLVKFPKAKIPDDTQFIETLVWVLDQARKGKIRGYAIAFIVDQGEQIRTIEAAKTSENNEHRLQLLGAIRCMEINFMKRETMSVFKED